MGARPYRPRSGDFASADPLGHAGSWELYSYANNDPVNFTDPDGRFGKAAFQGATQGDFYNPTNTAQTWGKGVGQFATGLLPVYGQAADVRDVGAAVNTVRTDGMSLGSGELDAFRAESCGS